MCLISDYNEIISVQVILQPSSKIVINGESLITSNNIVGYAPPPDAYALAKNIFISLFFEVGPLVGISFSITAKDSVFRKIFNVSFQKDYKGGIQCVKNDKSQSKKLPLDHLPDELIEVIQSITCTESLDFGPAEYF